VTAEPTVRPGAEPFSLGDGPIGVVMIHGFTGSPASMRPVGEWLAQHGVHVEGIRLPGHGTDLADLRSRRWSEWVGAAEQGLDALRARCRTVIAFGQSMGGSVALHLAATRRGDVDGLALANPYVFDARHLVIPVGRLFLREVTGVANDVSIPGVDENADARMPVPAIAQMAAMMRVVRRELPTIRQPLVLFRSVHDHVIPRGGPGKILARIGSERTELVECPESFHVVTLDRDAPLVRERLLAFARDIDGARAPA
jgi:carboxylesterase